MLLRRAWFGLNQAFRRRCAELGLTPDQYTVLRTLHEGDAHGMTQNELVAAMCSDPNTIASLLRRMEAGGLIERRPHEDDRRARRVLVLPAGHRLYLRARRVALALQNQILQVLPAPARDPFLAHLEQVAEACRDCAAERRD
jgi:DNA-binding MarR family transcriptional regulator